MRLFVSLAWFMLCGPAHAGEHDLAWAKLAGEHMGRAEAGAKCSGYKVNATRRDEVLALYGEAGRQALDAERAKARSSREEAIRKDAKGVCSALLGMYGPYGLAIANYMLPSGKDDVRNQVGIDHGLKLGVEPRAMEALHWLRLGGIATAIETVCGARYEMVPIVQAQIFVMGQAVGQRDAMMVMTAAMAAAGDEYELKTARPMFCTRILRDYGPDSERPLVRLKRR